MRIPVKNGRWEILLSTQPATVFGTVNFYRDDGVTFVLNLQITSSSFVETWHCGSYFRGDGVLGISIDAAFEYVLGEMCV